jgi:hypothetical protein
LWSFESQQSTDTSEEYVALNFGDEEKWGKKKKKKKRNSVLLEPIGSLCHLLPEASVEF